MIKANHTRENVQALMVGKDVLHQLKIQAVTERRTMREIAEELIRKYLEVKQQHAA